MYDWNQIESKKRTKINTSNERLSRHIINYSDWYDSLTVERAKADLQKSL